jgi:HAD superfamily hydrolase (TIGR01509 family)
MYETLATVDWSALRAARGPVAERLGVDFDAYQAAWSSTLAERQLGSAGGGAGDAAQVLGLLGVEASLSVVSEIAHGEEQFWRESVVFFDDVMPFLRELRMNRIPTALVSNCSFQTRAVVDSRGLSDHLDAIVLSCELGAVKPDPAIYMSALEMLGGDPGQTLLVDDTAEFLEGAARLGIQTMRISRRPGDTGGAGGISSLSELIDLL